MSEFLAIDRQLEGEAPTVEGRLADILAADDCVVEIDEYKLSKPDKARVVAALRLAATPAQPPAAEQVTAEPGADDGIEPVTVTIYARGDNENSPAEAVHHGLIHAHKAGYISHWTDAAPADQVAVKALEEIVERCNAEPAFIVSDIRKMARASIATIRGGKHE